ncbi:hypothetical protein QBC42DRAFT_293566 [Cladorrhinum samala]|uniref:Uncharacterized protein n=1 Tax=Cladorrhinum samala TaxID=585594 RepID=A0AAV9I5D9_9PEZI|nr:hypothetical protein QBC42DRAFT_293566 [Cladorrhinum samala]
MAGLKSLRFWKKKHSQNALPAEKIFEDESPRESIEKPSAAESSRPHPSARGVQIRPDVNPAFSAYSTPADPSWANSLTPRWLPDAALEAKLKDDGITDPEEIARRRADNARVKTEQEEQERMDFMQMM